MKTIGITKDIRNLIEANAEDGETINETLERLLNDVDELVPYEPKKPNRTNITITDENFNRLESLKSNKESYNSVIERLIISEKGKSE